MDPYIKAGLICLCIALLLLLLEKIASKLGFGQLIAVMRTTLFLIGLGTLAVGLIRLF